MAAYTWYITDIFRDKSQTDTWKTTDDDTPLSSTPITVWFGPESEAPDYNAYDLVIRDVNEDGLVDVDELGEALVESSSLLFKGFPDSEPRGFVGTDPTTDVGAGVAFTDTGSISSATKGWLISLEKVTSETVTLDEIKPGTGNFDPFAPGTLVPCFARGTLIQTPEGPRRVESLSVGDLVLTADHGAKPILWIGSNFVGKERLKRQPELRPIRICRGALGESQPTSDLIVSPQHRILVRSRIAQKMFGTNEVLVAAKQLLQIEGIDIAEDLPEVEYFHFLFDQHEVVLSNGAETESLYVGPMALEGIGPAAREEIFKLFPELQDGTTQAPGARQLVSGRMGRKLAIRHVQNERRLVEAR